MTETGLAALAVHARQGKRWTRWQAHRCEDRDHAYEVEERFLQQYKPHLNIQVRTPWRRNAS